MPSAELIAIGTELLLGEIQDTNTRFLARSLRDIGIDVYRATIIGDNAQRIAAVIQEACTRSDIVITSGGLGPTIDDPTREAVALAVNAPLEFKDELWEQIQTRFQKYGRTATDNNRRQAYIPIGALPVENEVGTAPAFIVQTNRNTIIALPGVPRELEHLLYQKVIPFLKDKYKLTGIIKACVLHTAGMGESQVDERIGDLEKQANPTVGLLAHPGQVDIRVTAKAASIEEADNLIRPLISELQRRLGNSIYGTDKDTLEQVLKDQISARGWNMVAAEYGFRQTLINKLQSVHTPLLAVISSEEACEMDKLLEMTQSLQQQHNAVIGLGASLIPGADRQHLHVVVNLNGKVFQETRTYGGAPANGILWATNMVLDYVRRQIKENGEK
ncbi:MAG: CinA family nicotinamide mononucleotide deamidase-related protein [Anaerolineae bacterium]|nr:CinA family nicotinamide mononucleotide deamidase-related protein [Anaerolineae bacterium]